MCSHGASNVFIHTPRISWPNFVDRLLLMDVLYMSDVRDLSLTEDPCSPGQVHITESVQLVYYSAYAMQDN